MQTQDLFGSLFDLQDTRLNKLKDPLVQLGEVVDWEAFRPLLARIRPASRKSNAGAPRRDEVMMFKGLVLQHLYGLSDEQLEYQLKGKVERFIRYLRYSFYVPLVAQLKQAGLVLDVETANVEVLKWRRDVANVREHQTTGAQPRVRWQEEVTALQPYRVRPETIIALPKAVDALRPACFEPVNLQHDLSVYETLLQEVQ